MHVDAVIHPLQAEGARRHYDGTACKETDSTSGAQDIKNGIRVKSIVPVALLDPEPVRRGNATADAQSRQRGNGVRWRKEEQVEHEDY